MKKLLIIGLLILSPSVGSAKHRATAIPANSEFYDVDTNTFVDVETFAFGYILGHLKNPNGAHFDGEAVIKQVGQPAGRYVVGGWVDATNSFGATIRTQYRLIIVGSKGNFRVTNCVFN